MKRIFNIIWYGVIGLFIFVFANVMYAKMNNQVPNVFGYSVMQIISYSMEPEIKKDEYILVKKVDISDIEEHDIITFYSTDPTIYGRINTHRVVRRNETNDGFVTKGDNNLIEDKYDVLDENVIGRYVTTLGVLTVVLNFFQTNSMLVLILLVQIFCIGILISKTILKKKNN